MKRYSQVFHASRKVGQQVPENDYSRGERLDGSNQVWCPLCRMTYSSSKMPSQMPTQEKLVPQGNPEREANFDVLYCAPTALCWSEPRWVWAAAGSSLALLQCSHWHPAAEHIPEVLFLLIMLLSYPWDFLLFYLNHNTWFSEALNKPTTFSVKDLHFTVIKILLHYAPSSLKKKAEGLWERSEKIDKV